jgi:hypothetical protein
MRQPPLLHLTAILAFIIYCPLLGQHSYAPTGSVDRSTGMRPTGSAEQLEARRMVAARLFALGKSNSEVAEACGVSLSSVKLGKRAWKSGGTAGLAAKPHLGPEPLLSDDDLVRLEKLLLAGAHKAGFASDLWEPPHLGPARENAASACRGICGAKPASAPPRTVGPCDDRPCACAALGESAECGACRRWLVPVPARAACRSLCRATGIARPAAPRLL